MPRIFGSASTGGGGTPGGSTTQVQYNNAGAFGGVTGATTNGTFLTLTTPVLGVAAGTSLALGGATIGSNALAVTGTAAFSGVVASGISTTAAGPLIASGQSGGYYAGVYASQYAIELGISTTLGGAPSSSFGTLYYGAPSKYLTLGQGSVAATSISVGGVNTLQFGMLDAASPVAQTIKFQDVVAGTTNTAGVNATIQAPAGTGTGAGGSLIFQVAPAGSAGSAKNAWVNALSISPTTFQANILGANKLDYGITTGGIWTMGGGLTVSGNLRGFDVIAGASAYMYFANRSSFASPVDGNILVQNYTATSFNLLQFGGTTSSFPAWKRSTTTLQAKLADDSAFTAIQGKLTTDTAYTAGDPTTTGYLVVYDSTGTAYRVPALLN